jgi:exonuclease III
MGKSEWVSTLMSERNADFFCLQEIGVSGDTTPPELINKMPKDTTTLVHGPPAKLSEGSLPTQGHKGVGLVIADGWNVHACERDGSGRAMAARISKDGCKATVVSVLLPTSLDSCSPVPGGFRYADWIEASDIYNLIESWTKDSDLFFIMGDFNETRITHLDRFNGTKSVTKRNGTQVLISDFVAEGSRRTDLGRYLSPNGKFYTRECPGALQLSRIDYAIVPSNLLSATGLEWKYDYITGTLSDHYCLVASVTSSTPEVTLPRLIERTSPWNAGHPRVAGSSDDLKATCRMECNREAEVMLARQAGPITNKNDLDLLVSVYQKMLKMNAIRVLGKTGSKRKRLPPSAVKGWQDLLRALDTMRSTILLAAAGSISTGSCRFTGAMRNLSLHGLSPKIATRDLDSWIIWSENCNTLRLTINKGISRAWAAEKGIREDTCDLKDKLFNDPASRGRFIDQFLRGSPSSASVECGHRDDGTVCYDPSEYLDIVLARVAGPMSTRIAEPPDFCKAKMNDFLHSRDKIWNADNNEMKKDPGGEKAHYYDRPSDARNVGCKYEWWDKMFSRDSKDISHSLYETLMSHVSLGELSDSLARSCSGKSPGCDGISIDLLKLTCLWRTGEEPPACLKILLLIVNSSLSLGYTPTPLREGWITMVPKPGKISSNVADMRPITVLCEIAKTTSRILAHRLGDIFLRHPHLIHHSQRGFLRDGNTTQCVDKLVDALEDHLEASKTRGKKRGSLYLVSYDYRKAFDKVQTYAIIAALRRFNLPPGFISFVTSGLVDSPSRVRTRDGLTKSFDLKSSVRQGDPLSPLLYIMCVDALHEGLHANPLFGGASDGYTFKNGTPTKVTSLGYADDTAVLADSKEGIYRLHEWVRQFTGACCGDLNNSKTVFIHHGPNKDNPDPLISIDGLNQILPKNGHHTFRYLGVHLNTKLDWRVARHKMRSHVGWVANSIRQNHFSFAQSKFAIEQFLFPLLWPTLAVAFVPTSDMKEWDKIIHHAALKGASYSSVSVGNHRPVAVLLNEIGMLPSILDLCTSNRAANLMVKLNLTNNGGDTTWARIADGANSDALSHAISLISRGFPTDLEARSVISAVGHLPAPIPRLKGAHSNRNLHLLRTMKHILLLDPLGRVRVPDPVVVSAVSTPTLWNHLMPAVITVTPARDRQVEAYTDGSSPWTETQRKKNPLSGFAVVFPDPLHPEDPPLIHSEACAPSGSNYAAECLAILAALALTPGQDDLTVVSDCLSAIQSCEHGLSHRWVNNSKIFGKTYSITQRRRILCPARSIISTIRTLISIRPGQTRFRHQRSHTGDRSFSARMNDKADAEAKAARHRAIGEFIEPHVLGEERVSWLDCSRRSNWPLLGDFRKHATLAVSLHVRGPALSSLHTQASILRKHHSVCTSLAAEVRKVGDKGLSEFLCSGLSNTLPTEASRKHGAFARSPLCKLCNMRVPETFAHVLVCPAQREEVACVIEQTSSLLWHIDLKAPGNPVCWRTSPKKSIIYKADQVISQGRSSPWSRNIAARFVHHNLNVGRDAWSSRLATVLSSCVSLGPHCPSLKGPSRSGIIDEAIEASCLLRDNTGFDSELVFDIGDLSVVPECWDVIPPVCLSSAPSGGVHPNTGNTNYLPRRDTSLALLGASFLTHPLYKPHSNDHSTCPIKSASSSLRLIIRLLGRPNEDLIKLSETARVILEDKDAREVPCELALITNREIPPPHEAMQALSSGGMARHQRSTYRRVVITTFRNAQARKHWECRPLPSIFDPIITLFSGVKPCNPASPNWLLGQGNPGILAWFNPFTNPLATTNSSAIPPQSLDGDLFGSFDRLTGLLGVSPPQEKLLDALKLRGASSPADPQKDDEALVTQVRLSLVRGALRVWSHRCRNMDEWLQSTSSPSRRRVFTLNAARRKRARDMARESAALNRFLSNRKKRHKCASSNKKRSDKATPSPVPKNDPGIDIGWHQSREGSPRLRHSPTRTPRGPGFSHSNHSTPSLEEDLETMENTPWVRDHFRQLKAPRL